MTVPEPIVNFVGDRIALGPITREELPLFNRWMNDLGAQIRIGVPYPRPNLIEHEEEWYDSIRKPNAGAQFLIRERATMNPIGSAGLHAIDFSNRKSSFGIMIGDANARGKGYGTETAQLILDFGFTVIGLHSISLTVAGFNLAGQKAYAKAGFKECGRLRESNYFAGQYWDTIYMDCLASEFESPFLKDQIGPDLNHE